MKLKKLLKDLDVEVKGSRDIEVTGISSHSQFVTPGGLFIARKGKAFDGTTFIPKAIETGAAAIVTDIYNPFLKGVVQIISKEVNLIEGLLAKRYYQTEQNPLYLIGITGTNGKTTVGYLIHALLPHSGLLGTIETVIGKQRLPSKLTTADVVTNHKTLYEMAKQGLKSCVMEVTSHALDQNRVEGLEFDVGVFTNFSQDHLDYHGTMEAYLEAKLKLFSKCKIVLYNRDDAVEKHFSKGISYSIEREGDFMAKNLQLSLEGASFDLHYNGKVSAIKSPLIGKYNVYNALAALRVGLIRGEPLSLLKKRLSTFKGVPGRLEKIPHPRGVHLFVDFAHTPDAIERVLSTLSSFKTGKLITVFGCGGDRDALKRPIMGEIAERYSDQVILTSDNPRYEDPLKIIQEIRKGMKKEPLIEVDRRKAIERGVFMAQKGDILLIAGRGHESEQKIGGRLVPFNDRKVAEEFLI